MNAISRFLAYGTLVVVVLVPVLTASAQDAKKPKIVNALLVNGKTAKPGFETATTYLSQALTPRFDGKPFPDGGNVRVRTLSAAQFEDASAVDLNDYDCIFLCDVPRFRKADAERLEAFVRKGGGVVFTLGANVDAEAYNDVLHNKGKGLLPAKLGAVHETKGNLLLRMVVPPDGYKQPPLSAFADLPERSVLGRPIFKKFMRMEEPSPEAKARTILSFEQIALQGNGPKPTVVGIAMLEWRPFADKGGRVVVFTSTVNFDWNSWAASPSFLPMMHEVVRFTVPDRLPPAPKQARFVLVANFPSTQPATEKKVRELLRAAKIEWVISRTSGQTLDAAVPDDRAPQARKILTDAMKDGTITVQLLEEITVPKSLRAVRTDDKLRIEEDATERVVVPVAAGLIRGERCELSIYRGKERIVHMGGSYLPAHDFERANSKVPRPGESYEVELVVRWFETDAPVQPNWKPESGGRYKVLLTRTLKLSVR